MQVIATSLSLWLRSGEPTGVRILVLSAESDVNEAPRREYVFQLWNRWCPFQWKFSENTMQFSWQKHLAVINRGFFRDFTLLLLISQLPWNEMNVELLLCFGFLSSLFAAISNLQTCVTALGFCLVVVQRLFTSALYFCTDFSSGVWILKGSESYRMIAWIMT